MELSSRRSTERGGNEIEESSHLQRELLPGWIERSDGRLFRGISVQDPYQPAGLQIFRNHSIRQQYQPVVRKGRRSYDMRVAAAHTTGYTNNLFSAVVGEMPFIRILKKQTAPRSNASARTLSSGFNSVSPRNISRFLFVPMR